MLTIQSKKSSQLLVFEFEFGLKYRTPEKAAVLADGLMGLSLTSLSGKDQKGKTVMLPLFRNGLSIN